MTNYESIEAALADIKAYCDAATKSPWYADGHCVYAEGYQLPVVRCHSTHWGEFVFDGPVNAACVARSRTDLPRLVAALCYMNAWVKALGATRENMASIKRDVLAILNGETEADND